jgi:hypothetical protein
LPSALAHAETEGNFTEPFGFCAKAKSPMKDEPGPSAA